MAARQVCTFLVRGVYLGLDVEYVREVLRGQEMTEVPLAPPAVKGLINLRGQIITALDLRRCLGLAPDASTEPPMHVILQAGDSLVSLLVDAIGEVEAVNDDCCEPVPATMAADARNLLRCVCKLQGKLLLLLAPHAVLEGAGRASAPPASA